MYIQAYFFFQDGANLVKKIKGIYCFKVKNSDGKDGVWVVDVKNGKGAVKFDSKGMLFFFFILLKLHSFCFCSENIFLMLRALKYG